MDDDNPVDKPEDHAAEKPDDRSIQKQLNEVLTRIDYMERVMRDQLARLYQIENRLGITPDLANSLQRQRDPKQLDRVGQPPAVPPPPPQHRPPIQQRPVQQPPLSQPGVQQPPVTQKPTVPPTPQQPAKPGSVDAPARPRQAGFDETAKQPFVPPTPPQQTRPTITQANAPTAQQPPKPSVPAPSQAYAASPFPQPAKKQVKSGRSLEELIGGTGLMIVGVIAMTFAVGFFLKLAFDRGYITPTYQVLIGAAIGIAFLAMGERLRKKYATYAYGLTGGGILILYLSIYAAFKVYPLINQATAMLFMCIVTATAALLSARYNAYLIALLGFIGGFLTPMLLSTGTDNPKALFGYITLLDAGVLALAFRKQWRSLNYMSFAATLLMCAGWWFEWYDPTKLWTALFFFTIFFMIYALVAVLYNVINRQPTHWLDLALVFINAVIYFASTYQLLNDVEQNNKYHAYLGIFSVLMAGFYSALGLFTYKRDREDKLLLFTFLGLTFLFLVLAVPIQFDQQWVTMAWAIQGAVMTWIGLRVKDKPSLYAGFALFFIAVAHWFWIDIPQFAFQAEPTFTPLLNARALSCAVLVASLATASWFYKRMGAHLSDNERSMFGSLYLLGANVFAITLFSLDANSYFEQKRALARAAAGADLGNLSLEKINNSHLFTLSALWSMYGAAALFIGVMRNIKLIRWSALVLLSLTALKVLAADWFFYSATWHVTIFNPTFISFVFLIGAFASGAWFYLRSDKIGERERAIVVPVLMVAANLFALLALSLETLGHYDRVIDAARDAGNLIDSRFEDTKQFVLSAVWTIYATVVLFVGVKRKVKAVRLGAVALLGLAIMKVLFVNLFYYDAGWHQTIINQTFAAFALLVLACAFGVWLYSRNPDIGDDERQAVSLSLVTAANLLAVTALSAEVMGHFNRLIAAADQARIPTSSLVGTKLFILSVLWTVYAAAALTIGIKRNSRLLRFGALLLLVGAIVKLFITDLWFYDATWHVTIFNETFGAFALVIAVLAFGIWLYSKSELVEERFGIVQAMIAAANLLAVVALTAEVFGYFHRAAALAIATNTPLPASHTDTKHFILSALWTLYGAIALGIGIKRGNRLVRGIALLLLMGATFKLIVIDLSFYDAQWHTLLFNQTFGAFALMVAALSCGVLLYAKTEKIETEERRNLVFALTIALNVLALVALSAEALGYFAKQLSQPNLLEGGIRDLRLAQQLSLSVIWTIYGGVLLTIGILRRNLLLRMMALLLLSLSILKVFFWDLSSLDRVYRMISFLVLGLILLAVSLLYQRFRFLFFDEKNEAENEPPATVNQV